MKRCTEWRGEHAAVVANNINYIDRLAKYEDSGLEPEEILAILAILAGLAIFEKHKAEQNDTEIARTNDGKKIIFIDDKPYAISLPTGGSSPNDHNNDWDRALDVGCPLDWKKVYSWCLNRVCRGYGSARFWYSITESYRRSRIGFRPVLEPLDPDTLKPDTTIFSGMDGQTVKLGTFAYDQYDNIVFDDTSDNAIEWAVFDGKLIATKVLEINVSWDELDKMGFVPKPIPENL